MKVLPSRLRRINFTNWKWTTFLCIQLNGTFNFCSVH